jgi:hypothetical protein
VRTDWVPLSASALVVGALALVFGSLLNPAAGGETARETLELVQDDGGRWLGMAVMYFFASIALTLGLPALLTVIGRRGRRLGWTGVAIFAIGSIGTSGYAMIIVFFRAMVKHDAVVKGNIEAVGKDTGLQVFLIAWGISFFAGLLLLAVSLLRGGKVAKWIPVLLLLFVAFVPFSGDLGRVGMAVQVMSLVVAFTGVAMAAVTDGHAREMARQPAF